jgi:hypothetical protein
MFSKVEVEAESMEINIQGIETIPSLLLVIFND